MAGLAKPYEHALATGTAELQPKRYENRLTLIDNSEIGACPLYFDPLQRELWNELVTRLWWLNAADYGSVELTAIIYARFRLYQDTQTAMSLLGALTKLGATPTSRGNVLADRSKDGGKKSRFAK